MPKFGRRSRENLETCHPDLQTLFNEVIKEIDCTVTCGHRNKEDQDKAVASGHSKAQFPHGKHNSNPSTAIDVYPYPIDFEDMDRYYYFAGFVMAKAQILLEVGEISHKIKWGGCWKGLNKGKIDFSYNRRKGILDDKPHFELIPNGK
tara:strand:- start:3381 stop:3824 length:444 start_codon:yes stop_codon:yes gene_type:complete